MNVLIFQRISSCFSSLTTGSLCLTIIFSLRHLWVVSAPEAFMSNVCYFSSLSEGIRNEGLVLVQQGSSRVVRTDLCTNLQVSMFWYLQNQESESYTGNTGFPALQDCHCNRERVNQDQLQIAKILSIISKLPFS